MRHVELHQDWKPPGKYNKAWPALRAEEARNQKTVWCRSRFNSAASIYHQREEKPSLTIFLSLYQDRRD